MYSRNTEIRHLAAADVYQLAQILEHVNSWKKLMAIIPKNLSSPIADDTSKKYTSEQIRLIENASVKQSRAGAEILFDEWGTSGRKRPTVGNLLELLVEAELFRAADYVALNFLKEPLPERPSKGPAAKIDISLPFDTEEIQELDAKMNDVSYPGSSVLIRNAKEPSDINNRDYYTKFGNDREKLNVEKSDLIKFSSNSINSGELPALSTIGDKSVDQIPAFSQLANPQGTISSNDRNNVSETEDSADREMTDSCNLPVLSAFQINSNSSIVSNPENNLSEKIDSVDREMADSHNLPALSAFQVHSTSSVVSNPEETSSSNVRRNSSEIGDKLDKEMTESYNLPAISALHLNSSNSIVYNHDNGAELPNLSALNLNVKITAQTNSSNTPTTSKTDENSVERDIYLDVPSATKSLYDSDNNLTPDLSILDQSSFDDSSLTNVTETSDDLSFDARTRLNLSENNIPMLSILQK